MIFHCRCFRFIFTINVKTSRHKLLRSEKNVSLEFYAFVQLLIDRVREKKRVIMLFCIHFFIAQFIITRKTRGARISRRIKARKNSFEWIFSREPCWSFSTPQNIPTACFSASFILAFFHTHLLPPYFIAFLNVIYVFCVGILKFVFPVEREEKGLAIWLKWAYKIRLFRFKTWQLSYILSPFDRVDEHEVVKEK